MELFLKRLIDLLDEKIPVSMVHTLVEQPLGAIIHDSTIRVHARLDLVDEDSPFVEIELYPFEFNRLEAQMAFTYPKQSIKYDLLKFEKDLKQAGRAEKIIPLDQEDGYFYELFDEIEVVIPEDKAKIDHTIENVIEVIYSKIKLCGFNSEEEDI